MFQATLYRIGWAAAVHEVNSNISKIGAGVKVRCENKVIVTVNLPVGKRGVEVWLFQWMDTKLGNAC